MSTPTISRKIWLGATICIVCAILVVADVSLSPRAQAQIGASEPVVQWSQTVPSPIRSPQSITQDTNYIYVAGGYSTGSGNDYGYIEKRDKITGARVWPASNNWVSTGYVPTVLAIDGTGLYIGGNSSSGSQYGVIEKRDLSTGNVIWTRNISGSSRTLVNSIAVSSQGLYVGTLKDQVQAGSLNSDAVIYRFNKDSGGNPINTSTNPFGKGSVFSIAADATGVYAITQLYTGNYRRLDKFSPDLSSTLWGNVTLSNTSYAYSLLTLDATGVYVYVYDDFSDVLQKRNLSTGGIMWTNDFVAYGHELRSPVVSGSTLYMYTWGGSAANGIVALNTSDGSYLWNKNFSTPLDARNIFITVDTSALYLAYGDAGGAPGSFWSVSQIADSGVGGSFIDIGLRVKESSGTVSIAAESVATSPLRIAKGGTVYGIALVPTTDANASHTYIKLGNALKALRKVGGGSWSTIHVSTLAVPSGGLNDGQSSTLSWKSQNAASCQKTGGPWGSSGALATNGSQSTGPISFGGGTQVTYSLSCSNSSGVSVAGQITITKYVPPPPDECHGGICL